MMKKATKYGLTIIAAALFIAVAFAGAASAVNIGSAEEWNAFATSVNNGDTTNRSANITITSSFSFGSVAPVVLGNTYDTPYCGNIEGGFNTISDFTIASSSPYVGLIGYYQGNCIKNLTIRDFSIHSGSDSEGDYISIGGLIGREYTLKGNFEIENVRAECGNVTTSGNSELASDIAAGGIVGRTYSKSTFKNCTVENCVVASSGTSNVNIGVNTGINVGGIIGFAGTVSKYDACNVINCSLSGNISVGGIVGRANQDQTTFYFPYFMRGCTVNNSIVSANSYDVGGLVGYVSSAACSIENCRVENCVVAGSNNVGGFVGYNTDSFRVSNFTNGGNWLNESAIRGTNTNVGEIVGKDKGTSIPGQFSPGKDVSDYKNGEVKSSGTIYKHNNSDLEAIPQVIIAKSADSTKQGPEKPEYFNQSYAGFPIGTNAILITGLTGYGVNGQYEAFGYVYASAVEYLITNISGDGGTVEASQTSAQVNEIIHVSATSNPGYHFVDWNVTCSTGDVPVTDGNFTMPASAVNAGADFALNVTTVTFYNDTVSQDKEFTYNKTAVADIGTKPFNTFRGWYDADGIQVFNETGKLNDSASGYITPAGTWGYEEAELSLYANYSKSEISVSTNLIGFGTFDLKEENPVVITPQYLNVINNLQHPVSISIDSSEIFTFNPALSSLPSLSMQTYEITIDEAYRDETADLSGILTITDGAGTTTYVKLSASIINTTEVNTSTTTIPSLPDIDTKVTGDEVNLTVDKDKVEIDTSSPNKTAVISAGSDNDVNLVITNITNSTLGDKQEISLAADSTITAAYPETKADLVSKDNVKVSYQTNIALKNITTDLPTLTGDINASANDKLCLGTNYRCISMVSALNSDIETLNENIESVTIIFNISKTDVVGFSISELRAFKIKDNGETVLLDATALSVEEYPEYYLVSATYPDGFSIDGIAVPMPQQHTPGSSSKQSGYTQILSEDTVTPTQAPADVPTIKPTVKPTTQQTQASPAPFVGLLAGLGAAAVLLRLRK